VSGLIAELTRWRTVRAARRSDRRRRARRHRCGRGL